jgi:ribosomal subunit interface protein
VEIEVRTRHTKYSDGLQTRVDRHFGKIDKLVSPLALLRLELHEEANPSIAASAVVEAKLHLKGTVLHAEATAIDMGEAIEEVAHKMLKQVHRYLAKHKHRTRRARREGVIKGNALPQSSLLLDL